MRCSLCEENIVCKSCYNYLSPKYGSVCGTCKRIGEKLIESK